MHHAYVYEGSLSLLPELALSAKKIFAFTGEHDPDVHVQEWEKFGIEDSRDLLQFASLRSAAGHSLFVLGFSHITSEAQQALLKLFEEPAQGVVFVVLVPHGTLLGTVRSRFLAYPQVLPESKEKNEAKAFLGWPYKKRSEWITAFVKSDEENTREKVRTFLNALEFELYTQKSTEAIRESLEDVAHLREYLFDKAPSFKMILEHIAVTLPVA